jgi:Rrf2 family protein
MISKKMKYALKALIHIANQPDGFAKTMDIAQKAMIPKSFLEQILLQLKQGRIINSKQGNVGGFYFAKNPSDVTLADIHRIIDGPIALVACASKNYYMPCADCIDEKTCRIRLALIKVRDETLKILEQTSIADMAGKEVFYAATFEI